MRRLKPIRFSLALLLLLSAGCASVARRHLTMPPPTQWNVAAGTGTAPERLAPPPATPEDAETARLQFFREGRSFGGAGEHWFECDWGRPTLVYAVDWAWNSPPDSCEILATANGKTWESLHRSRGAPAPAAYCAFSPRLVRALRVVLRIDAPDGAANLAHLWAVSSQNRPLVRVNGDEPPDAAVLIDADALTFWRTPKDARSPTDIVVDWGRPRNTAAVRVDWATANGSEPAPPRPERVAVSVSSDGVRWTPLGEAAPDDDEPSDVWMIPEERLVRWARLTLVLPPEGAAVAGVSLHPSDAAKGIWDAYAAAAQAAAASPDAPPPAAPLLPRSGTPVATVAAALPPDIPSISRPPAPILNTHGAWSPAPGAPSLWPLVRVGGRWLDPGSAATSSYSLAAPGVPLPAADWTFDNGLALSLRVLAAPGGGSWACLTLANRSAEPLSGRVGWMLRPLRPAERAARGGIAPVTRLRHAVYSPSNAPPLDILRVNGAAFAASPGNDFAFAARSALKGEPAFPDAPPAAAATNAASNTSASTSATRTFRDPEALATAAWHAPFDLAPGAETNRYFALAPWPPVVPNHVFPDNLPDAFPAEWERQTARWNAYPFALPAALDPRDAAFHRAQHAWTLSLFPSEDNSEAILWHLVAFLQNSRSAEAIAATRDWLADARETFGLDSDAPAAAGQSRQISSNRERETLPPALCGQFVYAVSLVAAATPDDSFLREAYPVLRRTMLDVTALTETPPEPTFFERILRFFGRRPAPPPPDAAPPAYGLVADRAAGAGGSAVHATAAQLWALLGWKTLAADARALGLDSDAEWADSQATALRDALTLSLRFLSSRSAHPQIPASIEDPDGPGGAAALAIAWWPCDEADVFPPAMLQNSLDAVFARFLRWRSPPPSPDPAARVPPARLADIQYALPLALSGSPLAAQELRAALSRLPAPAGWASTPAYASVSATPFPSPQPSPEVAALFVLDLRHALVCPLGLRLHLLCGAPADWFLADAPLALDDLPTPFGPLSMQAHILGHSMRVEIASRAAPPSGYRLWWPQALCPNRVLLNGSLASPTAYDPLGIDLPPDFQGSVFATFDTPPSPSRDRP